jgi:Mg-chelatase subunit ChlD
MGSDVGAGIPDRGLRRYRRAADGGRPRAISAKDAIRAFADDLLDTGDLRLTLDRAFRWGYRDAQGHHMPGLQEQLQDLRHRRNWLLHQIELPDFLDALTPALDRLDAIEIDAGHDPDERETPIDRLLDRLEHGYESAEAQEELDALRAGLASTAGRAEPRGAGQPGAGRGMVLGARRARAEQLRRLLFEGGIETADGAPAGWTRDADSERLAVAADAYLDLELLAELERIEAALASLESVGSVAALPDHAIEALRQAGLGDMGDWLAGWSAAATAILPVAAGEPPALPPDVVRAISRDLLKGLFRTAASPIRGEHDAMAAGSAGDPAETTRAWEPGRPLDLDLVASLSNAVRRGGASQGRIRMRPDDFAVIERGSSVAVSTVLAIDRSRSMGQSGGWVAARKLALAMHELIRQSYPRDSLDVVAFSSVAERVAIADVPRMQWDRFEHGTHLQAALALSRTLLRRGRAGTRQVVVITDGEPTLATVRGTEFFASPPSDAVLEATMSEVIRCTREGITINLVMLGGEGRGGFAEQVARVNRGRVFTAASETLGAYVLSDYVTR